MNDINMNFELKILTPIIISADENQRLDPYINMVEKDDGVGILDLEKLDEIFISDKYLFDEYIEILRNQSANSKDKFKIKKLLNKKRIKLDSVILKTIPYAYQIRNLTQITQCVKSRGIAYIPGSSIKGAIRTAILYDRTREKLNYKFIENKQNIYSNKKIYVGQEEFRSNPKSVQDDIFKNIIVRDTNLLKSINTKIYNVKNLNLYKSIKRNELELTLPMLVECISEEQKLETSIKIKEKMFDDRRTFVNKEDFYNRVNSYYEDLLNREIEVFEKLRDESKYKIINEYNTLLSRIKELRNNKNGFILRVGKLKGLFSNTVDIGFNDEELQKININKKGKKGEFPTSRWVITNMDSVIGTLGWIELKERG